MDDLANQTPPVAVAEIERRTIQLGFDMASEPRTGAMLRMLAATKPRGRLLELGTGTGLATAWLLDGMDAEARLTSVDVDPAVQSIARAVLGHDERLEIITEDGCEFLRRCTDTFDLIFADAMPGKYELLDVALALLRPGGIYVADDMLPQANWPPGHAEKVPTLLAALAHRPELRLVKQAWSSGLVIAARRA
jgi:predicted O-methyltransferase YrrM